jgi:MGT family glycosyltransferase
MGKAVALVYPTHGHLTPSLAGVHELVRRGEEVVFYATPRARAQVEKTGASFRAYEAGDSDFNPDPPTDGLLADMARLLALTERTLPRLLDEIRSEAPDYILIDTKSVWGRLAAEALELPAITLSVVFALTRDHIAVPDLVRMLYGGASRETLLDGLQDFERYGATARRLAARYGVSAPDLIDFLSNPQPLTIVFTSREFQINGDTFGPSHRFIGASLATGSNSLSTGSNSAAESGSNSTSGPPLVYVSLGTTFNEAPAFYQACFEAFADQPYQVLLSTGGRAMTLPEPPANVRVMPFVPQMEVLSRASVFVTHGGMNSANEGLWCGVPMVVVPQRGDQFLVGRRMAELGAGIAIMPAEATAARLRDAVGRLIAESSFRERARALGASLVAAGGPARAADEVLADRSSTAQPSGFAAPTDVGASDSVEAVSRRTRLAGCV